MCHDGIIFPIIRIRSSRRGKKEVVKITPAGLTIKEISENRVEPTLESLLADDTADILIDDVQRISRSRVGKFSESSLWTTYTVESGRGRYVFQVPDRDAANVNHALRDILQDRFESTITTRTSETERRVKVAGVIAVVFILLGRLSPELLRIGVFAGIIAAILGATLWTTRYSSKLKIAPPTKRRKFGPAGRKPFRSKTLGWLLKLIGLAWLVVVFHSNSVSELVEKSRFRPSTYIYWLLSAPGFALLYYGYRLCLRTFDPHRHIDPRASIVYLRGFDDDGRGTLQPTSFLAKMHGIESLWRDDGKRAKWIHLPFWFFHPVKLLRVLFNADRHSAEEVLAWAFRRCGPFVAIGRPGELLATPGADRMYVPHDDWQRVVLRYLDRCQAVVLQPSNSEGIRWEVQQVFERVPRHRILLSLINFRDRPGDFENFRPWFEELAGVKLPSTVPFLDEPCFVYFETDGTPRLQKLCLTSPLVWSFTSNAVDAYETFHTFIQGLNGGPRDLPRAPRLRSFHGASSTLIPAVGLLIVIFYASVQARHHYLGRIGPDLIRDRLTRAAAALPVIGRAERPPTVWAGKRWGYEFELRSDWTQQVLPADNTINEYWFEYRNGIGTLEVIVIDEALGGEDAVAANLRTATEELARKSSGPQAKASVTSKRSHSFGGAPGIDVVVHVDLAPGVAQVRRWRTYQSLGQTLMASVTMPEFEHYDRIAEDILATVRVTETPEARLVKEAREGKTIGYHGTRIKYTVTLPPIWKATDSASKEQIEGLRAAKRLSVPTELAEHIFNLRQENIATLSVQTSGAKDFDLDFPEESVTAQIDAAKALAPAIFPGFSTEVKLVRWHPVKADGRDWLEFEARVETTAKSKGFSMVARTTVFKGNSVSITAKIINDCPGVRTLVAEALDSIRIVPAPLPAGHEESWTGRTVFISRPYVRLKRPGVARKFGHAEVLHYVPYKVLSDHDGLLKVIDLEKEAWFDKSEALLQEKAVDFFTESLRANPDDLFAYCSRAEAWKLAGKTDNVIADYTQAIRVDPSYKFAYANRADALTAQGEYARAIKDYTETIRLDAGYRAAFRSRGKCRQKLGEHDQAIEDFTEALRQEPRDVDILNARANSLAASGQRDRAIEDYTEAIRIQPAGNGLFFNRGLNWEAKKDYDRAIADYTESIRLNPKYAFSFMRRGGVWSAKGDADKAISDYNEAIRMMPTHAHTWLQRGAAWAHKGDLDRAISDFSESLRLAPHDRPALDYRARMWVVKGEYDKAIDDLSASLRLDPKFSLTLLRRGIVWKLKKEYRKALEDYDAALRLEASNGSVLSAKAWIFAVCPQKDLRDGKKAIELALRACDLSHWNRPDDLAVLAAAYAETGDFASAVKWQEKALEDKAYTSKNGETARRRLQLFKDKKPFREE